MTLGGLFITGLFIQYHISANAQFSAAEGEMIFQIKRLLIVPIGKDIIYYLNFIKPIAQKNAPIRAKMSYWKQDMHNLMDFSM